MCGMAASIGKTAAIRIEVRERGHQRCRARAADAMFRRHVRKLAPRLAHARIGQRLDVVQRVQVLRIGDRVEHADRRKPAGHDAISALPADAVEGRVGRGHRQSIDAWFLWMRDHGRR